MGKWTMKNVLTGKTRPVIILTIILTIVINKLFNQIMSREVAVENGLYSSYNIEFSLGIYGVVFAIPAVFISILIMKFFMNKIKRNSDYSFEEAVKFKWYSIYGTVSGFIILYLLINSVGTYADQIQVSNLWEAIKWFLVALIIPVVIAVLSAKLINKVMLRITNTNRNLIADIQSGRYDSGFANKEDKSDVLKLLTKGRVSTIKGGLWFLKIRSYIIIAVAGIVFGLWFLINKITPTIGQSAARSAGWGYAESELHQAKKRLKSEAHYKAEQKRKQADHSRRRYIKQANYNAKYSQSEWNQAVRDEREYQEAKRNADQL